MKGLIIAGSHSGAGKTTMTLGLMAALNRRCLKVAPFKVGPDFIDPGHHTKITGSVSRNLDGWMLPEKYNIDCFSQAVSWADIAVVEGVMGLFDGYDGKTEAGSTAQIAKKLGLPVILVIDAGSMARSAAAIVQGFERFDKDLSFAGVIFNHVGSSRHLTCLEEALPGHVTMPCLGGIPFDRGISIPERHLGLVTSDEHLLSDNAVSTLADLMDKNIDVDRLLANLPDLNIDQPAVRAVSSCGAAQTVRIGVARDKAFCFYYKDNLDLFEKHGAELVFFSPLADDALPENITGLYFGGGYPEAFAEALAGNKSLRD
ncbi:MAG: cobyrinate a,c-diamide synthase, partial [bacterium]|nr:cobyrinate a,c-diamide synthase [bacterium]